MVLAGDKDNEARTRQFCASYVTDLAEIAAGSGGQDVCNELCVLVELCVPLRLNTNGLVERSGAPIVAQRLSDAGLSSVSVALARPTRSSMPHSCGRTSCATRPSSA